MKTSFSHTSRASGAAGLLALLLAPTAALATEVAVPRLIGNGIDDKQLASWTSSISSELDFMSEFTGASELGKNAAGFSASCLSSGSCLAKVARSAGCDATVAGAVANKRGTLDFYLVYADGANIVRTKEFTVEDSPSKVADTLSIKLSELISGESHEAAQAAAAGKVDEGAFDDGFDDDVVMVAPVSTSRRIPTNSSGGSDELDGFSLDEEEDRRGGAAVVAAPPPQRAPPPPPPRAEPPPPKPAPAPAPAEEEFSFALGGGVVSVNEAMDDSNSGGSNDDDDGGAIVAAGYGGSSSSGRSEPPPPRRESPPPRRDSYDDLDGGSRSRGSSDSRSSDSRNNVDSSDRARVDRGGGSNVDAPTVSITGRLGYSRFQAFNFVTYGAEIGVHPIDNLVVLGGIEGYSVRRDVPQELQDRGAPPVVWNSILPINVGAAYKFLNDPVRPYVGGDMLIIPGYVQDAQGAAIGLRVRGGLDIMVNENFGFNLNGALGIWTGREFDQLDDEFSSSAMVPQFSAGTVVAF
jgi:hypothetical protein